MEFALSYEIVAAFVTLTAIEIVLGVDNIVFISITTNQLPANQRQSARTIGLALAMLMRILLLLTLSWIIGLTADLFHVLGHGVSGRDLILFFGGAFLVFKATLEIHNSLGVVEETTRLRKTATFGWVLAQIALIDIVFSLDSVITAVGLVDNVVVMIAAIVTAVIVMMFTAGPISRFVEDHPSLKVLALAFLVLIGFALIVESWGIHVPKGLIYASMAFAFCVELLNMARTRRRGGARGAIKLRKAQFHDLFPADSNVS
ncbi:MAG: TerC family protein [Gammaproteobacteria bacterium]|nr:TerC family protein [Gammaproteobacteria bacterium]